MSKDEGPGNCQHDKSSRDRISSDQCRTKHYNLTDKGYSLPKSRSLLRNFYIFNISDLNWTRHISGCSTAGYQHLDPFVAPSSNHRSLRSLPSPMRSPYMGLILFEPRRPIHAALKANNSPELSTGFLRATLPEESNAKGDPRPSPGKVKIMLI